MQHLQPVSLRCLTGTIASRVSLLKSDPYRVLTKPNHLLSFAQCARRCLNSSFPSARALAYSQKQGLHLPKRRLAYTRWAEDLGDLPAYVPADNDSAWQSMGREVLVEFREAGADGTGALGVQRSQGLRGRYCRQSI